MAKPIYPGTGDNTPATLAPRETYWRRLIERWRASGQPKSTFCEREGVFPEDGKDPAMELEPAELAVLLEGLEIGKRRPADRRRPTLALR